MSMNTSLEQTEAIRRVITGVSHEIDARRWLELEQLFASRVTTDYTSLFGGEVQTQAASDLIAAWKNVLLPLHATQHLLGPITVQVQGDVATAECHVRGYHHAPGAPGGAEWMVAGHYVFELTQDGTRWSITRMTLKASYQTGNAKLLQEAAALIR